MSRRNSQEREVERLVTAAANHKRPMEERMAALKGLVEQGAVEEVAAIATSPQWPDDLREEAVYGLVELDATEQLEAIGRSGRFPPWIKGLVRELAP